MKDLLKPGALCVLHDTDEVKDCRSRLRRIETVRGF